MIKKIIIFIIIIILVVVGATFLKGNKSPTTSLSSTTGENVDVLSAESVVGEEFLITLLNLRSIELDGSVFEDKTFSSLKDFTITLVPESNVGRVNPFAPIGTDSVTVPASQTTTATTTTNTTTTTTTNTSPVTPPSGN